MDHTSGESLGQRNVNLYDLTRLLELVQLLRAWWEQFESTIRETDRAIAIRVHDVFVETAIAAREMARQLDVALPDFTAYDWTPSVPAPDRPLVVDF